MLHTCIHTHIHTFHACLSTEVHIYMQTTYMHECTHTCIHACVYTHRLRHVCLCIYIQTHMYTLMHVWYIHTYTYVCIQNTYFQNSVFPNFWNFCFCEYLNFCKYGNPEILKFLYFCNSGYFGNIEIWKYSVQEIYIQNCAILYNSPPITTITFS